MSSPTPFHRILCLVIFAALSWFLVVAKPIELPARERARHASNLPLVVMATVGAGGLRNELTFDFDTSQMPTLILDTPACTHPVCDAPDCQTTGAVSTSSAITCSSLQHCYLDGERESVITTDSYDSHGGLATEKLNALHPVLTDTSVAPFLSTGNYEISPVTFTQALAVTTTQPAFEDNLPSPLGAAPHEETTITHTATIPQDQDGDTSGPGTALAPGDTMTPVPGQKTVYVTVTEDPSTATTPPNQPFSNKPLSTSHPESKKTAIILGSVFGSLAVLCISVVSVDRLRKLRRRKREESQEVPEGQKVQEGQGGQGGQGGQEGQQCQDSVSSVEDMSELLRLQQQTYGYYGTQRVASSTIIPQQMKSFPTSSEPVELPTPKGDTVEKEGRSAHWAQSAQPRY
ncbi:hypothetical protein KVR01_010760 [Diaporthe batatas]|uniref:uncharacterized protein n=1 Tax=Diaporthe batatas TaxID=748121 RepID=UPI001D04FE56|nr:uncharacterized protein KVR01_010760 [Diaporthe batatas]KAG8159099.1 hypothetical protein KVR01_010760 [Diaporthe batatas]